MFLVGTIATSVPTAASYCIGTTPSIVASERTVFRNSDSAAIARSARFPELITAISAGNHRVAKFVCWQTLTIVASECTLGTLYTDREISREKLIKVKHEKLRGMCKAKRSFFFSEK